MLHLFTGKQTNKRGSQNIKTTKKDKDIKNKINKKTMISRTLGFVNLTTIHNIVSSSSSTARLTLLRRGYRKHNLRNVHCRRTAWTCSASSNDQLIDNLMKEKIITSKRIEKTLRLVDRKSFLPRETMNSIAYEDSPQPLTHEATISAPHMHSMALGLLEPYLVSGNKVLDVGTGSGYLAACMADLVGIHGVVIGIEHIPQLAEFAIHNLKQFRNNCKPYRERSCDVIVKVGDGRYLNNEKDEEEFFDCIHVGAAAEDVPAGLIRKLKKGGGMVIPVGPPHSSQDLLIITKYLNGIVKEHTVCNVRYVPLCDINQQLKNI